MLATRFISDYSTDIGYEAAWFASSLLFDFVCPIGSTICAMNEPCINHSQSDSNPKGN